MLNFFKRPTLTEKPRFNETPSRPVAPSHHQPDDVFTPMPVPQIVEGNDDSDWAEWEDSVSFMDSQFPTAISEPVRVRQVLKVEPEAPDAFSKVTRRST